MCSYGVAMPYVSSLPFIKLEMAEGLWMGIHPTPLGREMFGREI
jgi:hypothetical protein